MDVMNVAICPDCGGWIDEGDCSCGCGSTRFRDNGYEYGGYYSGSSSSRFSDDFSRRLARERSRIEKEEKEKEEQLIREREKKIKQIERELRLREYREQQRREKEINEKNPEYLLNQIKKVKEQIIASQILFISGPEHLRGLQSKVDAAFKETLRLQDKLEQFDVEENDDYDSLNEEIKTLKKENKAFRYLISHMDDLYCENAKTVLDRNLKRLHELEEKFDTLYPKRGLLKKRDRTKRTRITLE